MEIDSVSYLKFFFALLFVLGLIGGFALIARKLGLGNFNSIRRNIGNRLSVVESLQLDSKRKLLLIRCDEKDHLLLLGGATELLITNNIPIDFKKEIVEQPYPAVSNFMQKFLGNIGNKKNE
jgi:flagellar protein FliO/FliZ